jgi:hypothetical protein
MRLFSIVLVALSLSAPALAKDKKKAELDAALAELDGSAAPEASGLAAPEAPKLVDAGPAAPMELGLELGEPTGLTFTKALNTAGRLTARLGLLHRSGAFLFGLEAPVIGAGYQHDLLQLPVPGWQAHLTAGAGALLWLRGNAQRTRPMMAVEASVGLRLRRPDSPLVVSAHLSPQLDLMPYVTPAVVGGLGFSWAIGGPGPESPADADADADAEEEPKAEPEPKAKPKKAKPKKRRKAKAKPKRRSKRR